MKFADTTVKRYLFRHVRSKYIYIEPEEWNTAIFLPAENWYHRRDTMGRFTGKG
jgi:hypothetical protein